MVAATRTKLPLALGGMAWIVVVCFYAVGLATRGRADIFTALAYNAPIALFFLVLAAEFVVHVFHVGLPAGVRDRGPLLAIWLIGFVVLYLRLAAKSVEISGHLTWLPVLTAQSWALGFPAWFTGLGVLSTLTALGLKLVVFRGPSGIPGILVGMLLAMALLVLSRRGSPEPRAGEQCIWTPPVK